MTNNSILKTNQNRFGVNPFFDEEKDYGEFVQAMMAASQEGSLPLVLQYDDAERLSMREIKQFMNMFKHDTGLTMKADLETCEHCDMLHCFLVVDEMPDEEEDDWDEKIFAPDYSEGCLDHEAIRRPGNLPSNYEEVSF